MGIIDLIYPVQPVCCCCGKEIGFDEPVDMCPSCLRGISFTKAPMRCVEPFVLLCTLAENKGKMTELIERLADGDRKLIKPLAGLLAITAFNCLRLRKVGAIITTPRAWLLAPTLASILNVPAYQYSDSYFSKRHLLILDTSVDTTTLKIAQALAPRYVLYGLTLA